MIKYIYIGDITDLARRVEEGIKPFFVMASMIEKYRVSQQNYERKSYVRDARYENFTSNGEFFQISCERSFDKKRTVYHIEIGKKINKESTTVKSQLCEVIYKTSCIQDPAKGMERKIFNGIYCLKFSNNIIVFVNNTLYNVPVEEYIITTHKDYLYESSNFIENECYYCISNDAYVMSNGEIYKLNYSVEKIKALAVAKLNGSIKVMSFGKYYSIKQKFMLLILDGSRKGKKGLPHELWELIYIEYFDDIFTRFE